MKPVLITTPIEDTWPKNKSTPVIFLGEWCKLYSRESRLRGVNYKVLKYHWDDRCKLHDDYNYLNDFYEEILLELSEKLNNIHGTRYSVRYWRIVVGPWLGYFIHIIFDRWYMLKVAIETNKNLNCKVISRDIESLIPNNMNHFSQKFSKDDWNEGIYTKLLETCWSEEVSIEYVEKDCKHKTNMRINKKWIYKVKKALKKGIVSFFNKVGSNDNKYFFIQSYLPLICEIKLQLNLGQLPKFQVSPKLSSSSVSLEGRKWSLSEKDDDDLFKTVARKLIPINIPVSYLEGYKENVIKIKHCESWPKNPKVIFTGGAYINDDFFKLWAADKIEKGVKLIIPQHGGNFGMTPFSFYEKHQISISDMWLSWGWTDKKNNKIVSVGNLKNRNKFPKYDPNGKVLLIGAGIPRYSTHIFSMILSSQWLFYYKDQLSFLDRLPEKIYNKTILRVKDDYGWEYLSRIKNAHPQLKIDSWNKTIYQLVSKSRVFVSTINSTTYLESLSWNMPTIIFWDSKYSELTESAKLYINILEDVGIFHYTPEGAANQLITVWEDVYSWWESDDVQQARITFCHKYSKEIKNKQKCLEKVFSEEAG